MADRANFGSKLGVILATAGSAVGLGNVWRFPYLAGENGGAAFMLIYLLCVVVMGVPCLVAEFIIGRNGASNTARAYGKISGSKWWRWLGFMGVFTGFIITGYYAVVAGWCLKYVFAAGTGELGGSPDEIQAYFSAFTSDALQPIYWAAGILILTFMIVCGGVRGGIERMSKAMMPTLFVLLLVVVVASCTLPGAGKGVEFLLKPDFSEVTPGTFLAAMGQAFYSLSIGMGCICTYASYYSRQTNLLTSALQISLVDTLVAVLSGLMIFPAAFSVGVNAGSGPSLVFITLPNVFQQAFAGMPVVGVVVAMAFYGLLVLAALTSLMSLVEVATVFFSEEFRVSRRKSAMVVTAGCLLTGSFCSLSLGAVPSLNIGGMSLFDVFDFTSGQILLPAGGFFTCILLGWFASKKVVKDQFTNWGTVSLRFYGVFIFLVRYVCPLAIGLIFLRQFGLI